MAWVKRGGGSGTGFYGRGLAATTGREEPDTAPPGPEPETAAPQPFVAHPTAPLAYRTTDWRTVRLNRIRLEYIARTVNYAQPPSASPEYLPALEDLGPESPHLRDACNGDMLAGRRYQDVAAGGRFHSPDGHYWYGPVDPLIG